MSEVLKFPRPLVAGDVVGVTSPSSGVRDGLAGQLEAAVNVVESRGLNVRLGKCMSGDGVTSAPLQQRVDEFMDMLLDPDVRAIVPPWGGETAIDMVDQLDYDAISSAEPTWVVGYSDIATLITPLTLQTGIATVHGNNLMDTPYQPADGMLSWLDLVMQPQPHEVVQTSTGRYRTSGFDDFGVPASEVCTQFTLDAQQPWQVLTSRDQQRLASQGQVAYRGRLIGGCIETLVNLAGTKYLDVDAWRERFVPGEPLIVYVEAAEHDAGTICRNLHGMRLSGFFDHATCILVGRTRAASLGDFSQKDAVVDALGMLDVPIIADVDCGHCVPYLPLVNGALAEVSFDGHVGTVTQQLGS